VQAEKSPVLTIKSAQRHKTQKQHIHTNSPNKNSNNNNNNNNIIINWYFNRRSNMELGQERQSPYHMFVGNQV
jgi:hypothetical protein